MKTISSDDGLACLLEEEVEAHRQETEQERAERDRLAREDLALLRRLCVELRLYLRQREMNAFWSMRLRVTDTGEPLTARQRAWARTVEQRARKLRKASQTFTNAQLERLFAAMPTIPRANPYRRASRRGASTGRTEGSAEPACGASPNEDEPGR